jgi:Kef-type K+ transport system membrane component KefB/nucleotide-binding universal stress UspA family protein
VEHLQAPLPLFVMQAAAIIVVSRLLGLLARRIGQPMVVAEIVAGILLGPSLLGWAAPRAAAVLFPKSSMGPLGLTSQVGLVLFMFLIGLELDPKLLRGRARSSVAISYASILVPFGLGTLLAFRLQPLMPQGVSFLSYVLFMGAAMSITAFPVLARILVERRLLATHVGATAIACAAVDDVTAWCILAFVVSITRASSPASAVMTVVLAFAYILVMLLGVRPLLARFADRNRLGLTQNLVAVVVLGVLASSFVTEVIGIHALFGAFLFGAVLPKQGSLATALAEKIEDIVVVLLLPLFFAYSGLRTHIDLLNTPEAWATCLLITTVACVGKFGGSFVAGRLTGLSWREAGAVGILMNTRGLVELVLLNIALDLGVISPAVFTMMVVMALVTTFLTTPLVQAVYPLERFGAKAAEIARSQPIAVVDPNAYTAMICVARDQTGPAMLTLGAAVAGSRESTARLYALHLIPPADRASFVLDQRRDGEPDRGPSAALTPLVERATDLGLKVRPLSFVSLDPGKDICDVAAAKNADILVLGWHKAVVGGAMLTGVVHQVMVDAPCDVGVLVDRGLVQIRRVLVPYRGTEHDRAALHLAKRIAENNGAEITVLHVVAPEHAANAATAEDVRHEFEDGVGAKRYKVVFKTVTHAVPGEAAIEESKRGYDLLLVGIGRHWGLEHKTFGPRAEAILSESPISIMVVRRGERQNRPTKPVSAEHRARFATVA